MKLIHIGIVRWAAGVSMVALAVLSCAKDEHGTHRSEAFRTQSRSVNFIARQSGAWSAGDNELKLSLNYGSPEVLAISPSAGGNSAGFSAEIDFSSRTAPYTFYAIVPSSAALALSPSRQAWKFSVPCTQTPGTDSTDAAAVILAARSASYRNRDKIVDVEMEFQHLTAYGSITLTNLALGTAKIQAVELTAPVPLVGDWYWKCADGGQSQISDAGASSTLTIKSSGTSGIRFACAPVDLSGKSLTISVYTDAGVFEQIWEAPANSILEPGSTAEFNLDMTGAELYNVPGTDTGGILGLSDYGCWLGPGLEKGLDVETDQMVRSYDADGIQTFILVNPFIIEELKISGYRRGAVKGDTLNVTVNWRHGRNIVHEGAYSMQLLREEGPKLWIGDGSGKGFIIMK